MIKTVWKPRFTTINKKKLISSYDMVDIDILLKNKNKGWVILYTCDKCQENKLNRTTSHVLFKSELNTIDYQICRSCRSKISENEIKKSYIKYDKIETSFRNCNYKLLTTEEDYYSSNYRSQTKLEAICNNGHKVITNWNNWNCGKRCRKCYEKNKLDCAIKYKNGWGRYHFLVWHYSEKSYKTFKEIINPNNYKRGKEYHLDHKYSIYEGFSNNVPPKIIGGYRNLEVIDSFSNLSKGKKCTINLNEIMF
jgi:hypothetical protein